jgi:hypothetical protein
MLHLKFKMEVNNMKLKYFIAVLMLTAIPFVDAADLRGKLTGINGATIHVICEGSSTSVKVSSSGSYRVSNLPANKSCSFKVQVGSSISTAIPFSSSKNVSVYNGSIKKFNNKILVVRK